MNQLKWKKHPEGGLVANLDLGDSYRIRRMFNMVRGPGWTADYHNPSTRRIIGHYSTPQKAKQAAARDWEAMQ